MSGLLKVMENDFQLSWHHLIDEMIDDFVLVCHCNLVSYAISESTDVKEYRVFEISVLTQGQGHCMAMTSFNKTVFYSFCSICGSRLHRLRDIGDY